MLLCTMHYQILPLFIKFLSYLEVWLVDIQWLYQKRIEAINLRVNF